MLSHFIKAEVLSEHKDNLSGIDFEDNEILRHHSAIDMGQSCRQLLLQRFPDSNTRKIFIKDVLSFFKRVVQYLSKMLPINNEILCDLQVVHPNHVFWPPNSQASIQRLAKNMHHMFRGSEDTLKDEWNLYSMERIVSSDYPSSTDDLDVYWFNVSKLVNSTGTQRFPVLCKLAACIGVLSHGNADPERGFSLNKQIISDTRVLLSQKVIIGTRAIKDAIISAG